MNLVPFSFESHEIRVITHDDGSLSFVAKDVSETLSYVWAGSATIKHVPDEWKGVNSVLTPSGMQEMATLTEQGLYFFLNRSDKPKALPLQMWIAGEVLPSIRKTGSYSIHDQPSSKNQFVPSERSRLMIAREAFKTAKLFGFEGNMAILSAENYVRNTMGGGILESMGATHLLADERGRVYTPTQLGLMMTPKMTAIQFNLALEKAGLQKREANQWVPTDAAKGLYEWADTGKKHSNGTPIKQLRWFKIVIDHLLGGKQQEAA